MEERNYRLINLILTILLPLIILNLLILNYLMIKSSQKQAGQSFGQHPVQATPRLIPSRPFVTPDQSCSPSCVSLIKEATASVTPKSSPTGTPLPVNLGSSVVKEYFIPIGAGSTSSDEWEDLNGLQVYVDSRQYGRIKSAVFEASVRVPTKNQWVDVRLYNVTDKHPVWLSEVRLPGGSDPTLLTSQSIILDPGRKLYKVQMKTQLKHQAFLDQSRIHITTY